MTYVLLSLFWTLAGLAVGYWLGRLGRLEALMTATPDEAPGPEAGAPGVLVLGTEELAVVPRTHVMGRVLGLALIALAVLSVASTVVFISRQQQYVEAQAATVACQNAFNRATAAANQARAEASAKDRQGMRHLLTTSANPAATRAEKIAAYRSYLALLAEADEQRNANPLPAAVC